ncbi:MAG: extracellular solute-binding protein, partial [Clostridia bacterium]|nr:extracellular solute-binding protein [Clostridia bacterium]
MSKRILVLLLCGVMLLGMLAACAEQNEGESSSTSVEENSNWVNPELEFNDNLKGKEFNILSMRDTDIGPEENSSDPLEDAVYRRNDMIQSYYGITLNGIIDGEYNSLGQKVKTDVTAGTGDYDLVYQHMVDAATNLGMQGHLYNLADLEYVNFDNEWWDQDCKNGFMFGDDMFVVCGDLLPGTMLISAAVVFNKNLFDDRGWEYPYDDAREGTWTLDDMITMTKDQNKDLNGDGKLVYSDDFYGLVGWSLDCDYNFYFGSGA